MSKTHYGIYIPYFDISYISYQADCVLEHVHKELNHQLSYLMTHYTDPTKKDGYIKTTMHWLSLVGSELAMRKYQADGGAHDEADR